MKKRITYALITMVCIYLLCVLYAVDSAWCVIPAVPISITLMVCLTLMCE